MIRYIDTTNANCNKCSDPNGCEQIKYDCPKGLFEYKLYCETCKTDIECDGLEKRSNIPLKYKYCRKELQYIL